jgi:hypothetical protein
MAKAARMVILCGVAVVGSPACLPPPPTSPTPDLAVTIRALPNPVPSGFGYEIIVEVANLLPPLSSSVRGADVAQAELLLSAVPATPVNLISRQHSPELTTFSCQSDIAGNTEVCIIGPLPNGARYTIDSAYATRGVAARSIQFGAQIDPSNKIAERDETNDNAAVTVSFQ